MNRFTSTLIILAMALLSSNVGHAAQRIAVLNFELNDMTLLPNLLLEQLRTASIRPLLEQVISQSGDYDIIHINTAAQAKANSSFGYLFRFNDLAAKLGEQSGADWIIVGQHGKLSFLVSYLMVHLINVKTQTPTANFVIELKGNHEKVTTRAVRSLANKIHVSINKSRGEM